MMSLRGGIADVAIRIRKSFHGLHSLSLRERIATPVCALVRNDGKKGMSIKTPRPFDRGERSCVILKSSMLAGRLNVNIRPNVAFDFSVLFLEIFYAFTN